MTLYAALLLGTGLVAIGLIAWRLWRQVKTLQTRYSAIIDVDSEIQSRRDTLDREARASANALQNQRKQTEAELVALETKVESEVTVATQHLAQLRREAGEIEPENNRRRAQLAQEYDQALSIYNRLKQEANLLEENIEDLSFGLYKPHFAFATSEEYKTELENRRDRQRELVRNGKAAACPVTWTVGASEREGARMVKQHIKLLLRAFNGECDAAVANVTWNNVTKMEERIQRTFKALNDLGSVLKVSITPEYLNLRLDEVRLAHEYEEKKYQEKEEQRRVREQIREEERAQREFEKAREEAEREEARYQKALEKAREEAAKATGTQLEKLTSQIQSLEEKVTSAHKNKERAIARAQLTKSGFVYVISNIGSFGEHVFKVGMTRRLEPMDRIIELGDASVPFAFDLHAMLYSDNAPELESSLHRLLESRRLNMVNPRKEFYRNVELDEIEAFVRERGLSAQFIKVPEAKEYRETLAIREAHHQAAAVPAQKEFADNLFHATV